MKCLTIEGDLDSVGDGRCVVIVVAEAGELGGRVLPPQDLDLHGVTRFSGRYLLEDVVNQIAISPPGNLADRPA